MQPETPLVPDPDPDNQPTPVQPPRSLDELDTIDDYLRDYGRLLAHKAITSLDPLHVPERDGVPDFSEMLRQPFEPQKHVIDASTKMLRQQSAGFLVGEMGCGKTLIGMCAIHALARGKPYRAIVLCPDHLIAVWEEELRETIPGVIVNRFASWKEFLPLLDRGHRYTKDVVHERDADGTPLRTTQTIRGRWAKPEGPEWTIVGRNQAKWYPDWIGVGEPHRGFNGELTEGHAHRNIIVAHEPVVDDQGRPVRSASGGQQTRAVISRVYACPKCGTIPRNKQGIPLSAKHLADKQIQCEGFYADEVPNPDKRKCGRDRITPPSDCKPEAGREFVAHHKKYVLRPCGERLWNYTSKPYRWAPARIIQKKLRRMFKYLIVDEVHEQKSDQSAQSMAAGKLMAATDYTLALTGTLIGGYANHLYPLMMRMTPKTLIAEGFEWGKDLAFSQVYGRIDRIVTTKMGDDDDGPSVSRRTISMRKVRGGRSTERLAVRPGIMPTLFGRHMIGSSLFITLEELADELPDLFEYVGGVCPRPPRPGDFLTPGRTPEAARVEYEAAADWHLRMAAGWHETACEMDAEVEPEYRRIEAALVAASKELLKKGSMKLLGTMLYTLLDYPDMPYGWVPDHEGEKAVGYYDLPRDYTVENWRGVVQPADLCRLTTRPKERALINICKAEKAAGKQTWVYMQMTGKRNLMPRLKGLLEAEGLRVAILRADTVKPIDRKEWIDRNGPNYDVILSHPKLVSTGLTLFSRGGGHNFPTLVFYETGYSLFDMRQASRRAWRIGQPFDCKVYYLYYRQTMQHRSMQLMSRKMAAAAALEGEFSTEGLVAMAGEDNAQMAMARCLSERIDDADVQRSWGKVKQAPRKRSTPQPGEALAAMTPGPIVRDAMDDLPIEAQLLAETILDDQLRLKFDAESGVMRQHVEIVCGREVVMTSYHYPVPEPEPEPVVFDMSTFGVAAPTRPVVELALADDDEYDEGADEEETLPMLSREQLARMMKNLIANGLSLADFADES